MAAGTVPAVAMPADAPADCPILDAELARAVAFIADFQSDGIDVPVPRDPGGGYTHERHKLNYKAIYTAGMLFRITGERRYADLARDLFLKYAELYPGLGDHPAKANQQAGRLFWQSLNDSVAQVHMALGYAEVKDAFTAAERAKIETDFLRPAAAFLSAGQASTFSRIHNHATWAAAGVGITGYVLDEPEYVERALFGLDKSGTSGFLAQTNQLFSPDGYYAEGPYYQRYALMPFMLFADAVNKNEPGRRIFAHRDGILLKALSTTIELTYDGYFLPLNDAVKDKSLRTEELYHGIAVGYGNTANPRLLSIAEDQGRVALSADGVAVARAICAGLAQPLAMTSRLLRDGANGDEGALAIFRTGTGPDHMALIAKNTSQGMGHGHFDKLNWLFYDNGEEVVRDYGAARFLNIEAKDGGRYLPENTSWAKQTVAHNTLVVDGESHFGGDADLAQQFAPSQLGYIDTPELKLSRARIDSAYPDVTMTRTLAMVQVTGLEKPVVVDLLRVEADRPHRYDLPLHYQGQLMRVGPELNRYTEARPVLGAANGYQHIWVDARGEPEAGNAAVTWLLGRRFYTYRFIPQKGAELILGESGANDPQFNLRREPLIIQRVERAGGTSFVSLLEAHGNHDGAAERTVASDSQIRSLTHERQGAVDIVRIETLAGGVTLLAIADGAPDAAHGISVDGTMLEWTGTAARFEPGGKTN